MRKIVARRDSTSSEVAKKTQAELGRPVEVPEIAQFASPKCKGCYGSGSFVTLTMELGGGEGKVRHACGCARSAFLEANISEVGYDPKEKGIPVRWLKDRDPRANIEKVAAAIPPGDEPQPVHPAAGKEPQP